MAVWVKQRDAASTLCAWPALPVAMAIGVTASIAISMIERSDQPHDYRLRIAGIVATVLVGAWLSPWHNLSLNLATKHLRRRRIDVLGVHASEMPVQELTRISLSAVPHLRYWRRYHLQLAARHGTWLLPLGWSWRETSERRFVAATQPWLTDLRRTVPAVQVDLPSPKPSRPQLQLSLRRLMLLMSVLAMILGGGIWVPWRPDYLRPPALLMASIIAIAGALIYRPGSEVAERFLCAPIAMYFPMLWIIAVSQPFGRKVGLYEEAMLYPAIWVSFLPPVQILPDHMPWSATFVILGELALSLVIAMRGWKWTLPWVILLLSISTFGALILRAFALE